MQKNHVQLTLCLLAACSGTALAQSTIWTYSTNASQADYAPYAATANGDVLMHGARFGEDGHMIWYNRYNAPGALTSSAIRAWGEVNGSLVGYGHLLMDGAYENIIVRADANGQPTSAVRIVDSTANAGPNVLARVIAAPDGGWLVIASNIHRFHADGSLWWSRHYESNEWPRAVTWAPDGGFYGLATGVGIIRFNAEGVPLRRLNTANDLYGGELAITVKHPPILYHDTLYIGIGVPHSVNGFVRSNMGVMICDTLGNILGHVMNDELLSPEDDNCLATLVTMTMLNGRLYASLWQSSTQVGGRNYLMDCALDLSDAHWYEGPSGGQHWIGGTFTDAQGRLVLAGAFGNEAMHVRLVPGSDISGCFPSLPYTPAPLVLNSYLDVPEPSTTPGVSLHPITLTVEADNPDAPMVHCTSIGMQENALDAFVCRLDQQQELLTVESNSGQVLRSITLHDQAGRLVYQTAPASMRYTFSVQDLKTGVYFVLVCTGTHTSAAKVAVLPRY